MKKLVLFFVCAFTAVSVSAAPQTVDFDKLPQSSQEFVQKYFSSEKVKSVEMDRQASWDKYTVYFNSGNQVSFEGGSGDVSQIIMKRGSVPAGAIPSKVRSYVAGNYSNLNIVMWESTANGHKIGLSDKTYVDFDKDGSFVKAEK